VTRVEEPRLGQRFGAAYRAYLRSVPRWIPRVTR
jgi:protein-S-isoprenylcysteine O-methyltransferase Ste14